MKTPVPSPALAALVLAFILHTSDFIPSAAAQPTAFTYQGFLTDQGAPANGVYDLKVAIVDSDNETALVIAGPLTNSPVAVTNGLFTVTLDFGAGAFDGSPRWLELAVRPGGGGSFVPLSPRQRITSAPYALKAANAMTVAMGTISDPSFIGTTTTAPLQLQVNNTGGFRLEYPTVGTVPNLVGGYSGNSVGAGTEGAVIAGGGTNGAVNSIGVSSSYSAIGGGRNNHIASNSLYATIVGGVLNDIGVNSDASAIGGGLNNNVASNAMYAVIPGGYLNGVGSGATSAFAAGRRAKANHQGTFVWADSTDADFASTDLDQFLIRAAGGVGIGTGAPQGDLHIRGSGTNGSMVLTPNVSDSQSQILLAENQSATLGMILRYAGNEGANPLHIIPLNAGGVEGAPQFTLERFGGNVGIGTNNPVEKLHVIGNILATGTVWANTYLSSGAVLTLGSADNQPLELVLNNGRVLRVEDNGDGADGNALPDGAPNIISGSTGNYVGPGVVGATIAGGGATNQNSVARTNVILGDYGTISGGIDNRIEDSTLAGTISGGSGNRIQFDSSHGVIGGGVNNTLSASSINSTIAGGLANSIRSNVLNGTIGGGAGNIIFGSGGTVPGGQANTATNWALAAGRNAKANHTGAFVWGDSTNADVVSTNADSVTFRASGGVRFFSSSDTTAPAPGVFLAPGQSAWSTISDRTAKKDFAPVDNVAVLEKLARMPVQQWHYDWEEASATPHIGPMAQDFKAAFYPGRDDRSITTLEFDGVALAAIQGLNQKLADELKRKDAEIATLQSAVEELRRLVLQSASSASSKP